MESPNSSQRSAAAPQGALISIDMSEAAGMAPTTVHHMPCAIKCDGYAGVSTYFQSTVEQKGEDKLEARFRGRLLEGRNINLPQNVQGYVFREKALANAAGALAGEGDASTEEECERAWSVEGKFSKLTYWTHDKVMSEHDHIPQTLDWMRHANVLHAPLPLSAES